MVLAATARSRSQAGTGSPAAVTVHMIPLAVLSRLSPCRSLSDRGAEVGLDAAGLLETVLEEQLGDGDGWDQGHRLPQVPDRPQPAWPFTRCPGIETGQGCPAASKMLVPGPQQAGFHVDPASTMRPDTGWSRPGNPWPESRVAASEGYRCEEIT
jgi:hypothetical protein